MLLRTTKAGRTYCFIHILWQIRQIQVRVIRVRKCLETLIMSDLRRYQLTPSEEYDLRPYPSVFGFVVTVVEPTDGILGVVEVVVFDETKPAFLVSIERTRWGR